MKSHVGVRQISTIVTSGGASSRMGGPQVPVPLETWMREPALVVVVPHGIGYSIFTRKLNGKICPLWT